jgi:hypothetical protein
LFGRVPGPFHVQTPSPVLSGSQCS